MNKPFKFSKPLILIHGLKDDAVNFKMPQKIMKIILGKNVQIRYLKTSDHKLSSEQDLKSITNAIDNIKSLMWIMRF